MSRRTVDLPQPLAPIRLTKSPAATVTEIRSSTSGPAPKRLETSMKLMKAGATMNLTSRAAVLDRKGEPARTVGAPGTNSPIVQDLVSV